MTLPGVDEVIVHVVRVDLACEPDPGPLAVDERARASRFVRVADRCRYIAARRALRVLLGAALDVPADTLRFEHSARGRPWLLEPRAKGLDFNVSHSGTCALVALGNRRRVGVDVEATCAPRLDVDAVARSFSPAEQRALAQLAPAQRRAAFFATWVRKEAYAKAVGEGLGMAFDGFDVATGPQAQGRHEIADGWAIEDMDVGEGFAAAVAVSGTASWRLRRLPAPL